MKKNTLYTIIIAAVCLSMGACDFLDKNPDMRATIDTKDKVRLLLVSAYSDSNPSVLMEFSSDNILDNNAPDATGHTKSLVAFNKMYDEIFAWEPVVSSGSQDSPKSMWNGCYSAIAACNQALQAIAELEAKGTNMDAEKGEALLSRAYHHFLLACIFCQPYKTDALSQNDMGLVYMTEPETTVKPTYHRESLTATYNHIQEDLEAGLKLVSDEYYSVPKYHFNVKAAHAFAARFYLYKREWEKVIAHSTIVLGTDTEATLSMLFDNYNAHITCTNAEQESYAWIDANSPSNLLIMSSYSYASYTIYPSYGRYQLIGNPLEHSLLGAGPIWKKRALVSSLSIWSYGSDQWGSFLAKYLSFFEYTDKVNGYGYAHSITRQLTTNETLLCRAEAEVMMNDLDAAVTDLRTWCRAYDINEDPAMDTMVIEDSLHRAWLTKEKIQSFYYDGQDEGYAPKLNTDVLGFTIPAEKIPFIQCCIHFRRIETIHDGWRWMDLKRYGIEISHIQGTNSADILKADDARRAIQLPQEVILAGLEANPRPSATTSAATTATLEPDGKLEPSINANIGISFTRIKE